MYQYCFVTILIRDIGFLEVISFYKTPLDISFPIFDLDDIFIKIEDMTKSV